MTGYCTRCVGVSYIVCLYISIGGPYIHVVALGVPAPWNLLLDAWKYFGGPSLQSICNIQKLYWKLVHNYGITGWCTVLQHWYAQYWKQCAFPSWSAAKSSLQNSLCNNYATHPVGYTQHLNKCLIVLLRTNHNRYLNRKNVGMVELKNQKICQDLLHTLGFLMAFQPLRLYMSLCAER